MSASSRKLIQTVSFPVLIGKGEIAIVQTTGIETIFHRRMITKTAKLYYPNGIGNEPVYVSLWDTRRNSKNKERGWSLRKVTQEEVNMIFTTMV